MRYWLMKTEPETFSIDDLCRKGEETWDGVRNYQARNFMRDDMRVGDAVLIYHSSTNPPGVAGMAEISREAIPDRSALDPASKYFDPKATVDDPRWVMVTVRFVEKFPAVVPLATLKHTPGLEAMGVVRPANRLSIQPVTAAEFAIIRTLAHSKPAPADTAPSAKPKPKKAKSKARTKAKAQTKAVPTSRVRAGKKARR